MLGHRPLLARFIQVFVLAGDGKWYPQADVVASGFSWSCKVALGDPIPTASEYEVVALLGCEKVTESVIDTLPAAKARASVVLVRP